MNDNTKLKRTRRSPGRPMGRNPRHPGISGYNSAAKFAEWLDKEGYSIKKLYNWNEGLTSTTATFLLNKFREEQFKQRPTNRP